MDSHSTVRRSVRAVAVLVAVSMNAFRHLSRRDSESDWDRITGNDKVDLIGWQESKSPEWRSLYPTYRSRGWDTWHVPDPDGPISVAISWRTSVFELESVEPRKMHDGGFPRETTDPFPARWVVEAHFRHKPTGRKVILLNTHVTQHIETGHRFQENLNARRAKVHLKTLAGMWDTVATSPDDVVVGTGDYNFDYADDSRYRPVGGITKRFRGKAVSSYQALGLDGVEPSRLTRWIDYVFLSTDSLRRPSAQGRGTAQFARHRTLNGFRSDHRPYWPGSGSIAEAHQGEPSACVAASMSGSSASALAASGCAPGASPSFLARTFSSICLPVSASTFFQ